MKKPRGILPWLVVFAAGFFLGIVYSAWRLDKVAMPASQAQLQSGEEGPSKEQISTRIDAVKRMLEKNPNDVQALIELGNDYYDAEDFTRAVEAYQKVLKVAPRNADVLTDMGVAYRKLSKPYLAVEAFRKALEVDPKHSKALFNLGLVLRMDLKDRKGAIEAWGDLPRKSVGSIHGSHGQALGGAASKRGRAKEIGGRPAQPGVKSRFVRRASPTHIACNSKPAGVDQDVPT